MMSYGLEEKPSDWGQIRKGGVAAGPEESQGWARFLSMRPVQTTQDLHLEVPMIGLMIHCPHLEILNI